MKKLIALLCVVMLLCTCVACSKEPNYDDSPVDYNEPTTSVELKDPQKENAIPTDDLSRYATTTGALTNYRIAAGYTSTAENIVNIILHDGTDQQTRRVFYNTINPDGTATMTKQEEWSFVWSENAKYTIKDGEKIRSEHSFTKSATETTFAVMVDELICAGFYDAIISKMSTATYNIVKDYYELETIELVQGNETFLFDEIYITVFSNQIESIHCNNGTQSIIIELTGVNDVDFGGTE